MPIIEAAALTTAATWLAKGVFEEGRKSFVRSLKTPERERALRRCSRAALAALVKEGCPEEAANDLREHLEGALGELAKDGDVQHILGEALRRGRLPEEELDELERRFRELHAPDEVLPGFHVRLGVTAFADAFVAQAEEEESFQGLIRTKELRAQTGYLGEILEELRAWHQDGQEARQAQEAKARKEQRREGALREGYLNHLFETVRPLALSGIDPALAGDRKARLALDSVYTGLVTTVSGESEGKRVDQRKPMTAAAFRRLKQRVKEHYGRPESALEQLDRHDRLVLLGDPGGGKSTFVSFLALCMAGELLARDDANLNLLTAPLPDEDGDDLDERQLWSHGALLPVRVVLRDFAANGLPPKGEKATAHHLWDFIRSELAQGTFGDFAESLEHELRDQGGLILLDGLDEVPAAEDRRIQLRDVVEDFARAFPKCRILVTSRVYAYQSQEWQLDGFEQATLAPFSDGQIHRFVDRWYREVAHRRSLSTEDARGKSALLRRAVFGSPRLSALAKRPLLLTLMASLHAWRGGSLPEKRERLYADAVELLLAHWESQRVVHKPGGEVEVQQASFAEWLKVDQDRLREALDELAFEAHAGQADLEGTADLREGEVIEALLRVSRRESGNPDVNPAHLVEYLRDRAGLLLPRGVGVYTFPHRTFQEYLAACHLTSYDFPDKVARLAREDPNRWREVALLAGAKAAQGTPSSAWQLAQCLSYRNPDAPEAGEADHWGALLAGQLLVEAVDIDRVSEANAGQLHRHRDSLVALLKSSVLPPVERAAAGRTLARLGDPREEVLTVDAMQLCLVPAGEFLMGSREDDEEADDDEKPQRKVEIPYDYWIGRHPVTQAQFREFVDDGGYRERRFWSEAEELGWWAEKGFAGDFDPEPRTGPARVDDPFELPNHPVVGVSWFEALAFCRWLTERWRSRGWLAEGEEVRLPGEAEWEKAARGGLEIPATPRRARVDGPASVQENPGPAAPPETNPDPGQEYPWEGPFSADRANCRDTGIGSTSAVGCFPGGASPYGCRDLAGNVLEWCRDPYRRYEEAGGVEGDGPERDASRVLRGGSFNYFPRNLRAAYRHDSHPAYRYDRLGFRVLRPSSRGLG
ncbi:MAG: SUMF1/EgtB/PvdO family nonheme iron enzyme [Gemmatimonadota bacterium]